MDKDLIYLLAEFRMWWNNELQTLFQEAEDRDIDTLWARGLLGDYTTWQDLFLLAFDLLDKPTESYTKSLHATQDILNMHRSRWISANAQSPEKENAFQEVFLSYLEMPVCLLKSWGV